MRRRDDDGVVVGRRERHGLERERRDALTNELAVVSEALNACDWRAAAQGVRRLMFLEKFGDELAYAFEAIETR